MVALRSFSALMLATTLISFSGAHMALAAQPVPQVGTAQITAVAHPYAAPEDAPQAVENAFAEARKTGRKVLIDFGANWCPDCRVLAGVLDHPAVAPWVQENFVVVPVNVDHFNKNMDIARKYGVTIKAIPVALIVTPEGKVLNADATLELGDARSMSAQAVVDKLAEWSNRT
ncbi:putative thioredoxin protein [Acetobacter tropicalis NBRC 101654]|uniref:Putative thioredoxin protein n=1 Tax=Acetobacter tropicalis NBRC 101654 TaxID=749388 RepID=F7VEM6_9PROT|nr:thioredoxin family protein [Acetobacter tropicalis]GAA08821.1 putative thioredoxin protein [Acetobacter tropicalis NBRC 101654]